MTAELKTMPVDQVANLTRKTLIDVRTPVEYATVHATGAVSIPLDELNADKVKAAGEGPYYILCKSGGRAKKACDKLNTLGLETTVVTGGTDAWVSAGLPAVRSQSNMIPLERQTLIGAGTVVLAGLALGTFVNPWFYLIAAFAGSGLVFAGLSGICMMGLMLARMPWNKNCASGSCCTK